MGERRMKCFMCERRAKSLTAQRDGKVYRNAKNIVLFCSIRCAANYALLWGKPAIDQHAHFCSKDNQWNIVCSAFECLDCNTKVQE